MSPVAADARWGTRQGGSQTRPYEERNDGSERANGTPGERKREPFGYAQGKSVPALHKQRDGNSETPQV